MALWPSPLSSSTASSRTGISISAKATFIPASAKRLPIERPIPEAPPVISAVSLFTSFIYLPILLILQNLVMLVQ